MIVNAQPPCVHSHQAAPLPLNSHATNRCDGLTTTTTQFSPCATIHFPSQPNFLFPLIFHSPFFAATNFTAQATGGNNSTAVVALQLLSAQANWREVQMDPTLVAAVVEAKEVGV